MYKAPLLCLFTLLLAPIAWAQHGGNAIYGHQNRTNPPGSQQVWVNDSTLKISAKVLLHFSADRYLAIWGLQEEASTASECTAAIDRRIEAFTKELNKQFGIKNCYVDMVAQSPTFDYEVSGKVISQKKTGFEIKKNVICAFTDLGQINAMVALAANNGIYDLIKVDYVVEAQEGVYAQAFALAQQVLSDKQARYESLLGYSLGKPMAVGSERFYLLAPPSQYTAYTASESSDVRTAYGSDYVRKEARKRNTFYYNGMEPYAFDRIAKPGPTEVGMQAVLELSILFRI